MNGNELLAYGRRLESCHEGAGAARVFPLSRPWAGCGGPPSVLVIRGFLVSLILMSSPEPLNVWDAASMFHWRRSLRLWPTYCLCIALAVLGNGGGMQKIMPVNAAYLSNFQIGIER